MVVEVTGMESAVVYLRISEDRTGRQSGVSRQLEDCELLANRRGLTVATVLVDNDLSAYDGTRRPGYEALVGHIRAGISRIVVWHLDRLYRQPWELEALIDLVEDRALRIETVNGGLFDLNTHEGRLMARQFVAIAAYESGHKADRVARAMRQRAEAGAWHGPARYGYATGGVLVPAQAAVIRRMADRFLAGESIRTISAWLNATTPPPGKAAVWYPRALRSILGSARIAGLRAHDPGVRNDPPGGRTVLTEGQWEPIITPAESEQIRSILADPARRRTVPAVPSLLGGIARCGRCGAGLVVTGHKNTGAARTRRYVCRKDPARPERGGLSIDVARLEQLVADRLLERLAALRPRDIAGDVRGSVARLAMLAHRRRQITSERQSGLVTASEYAAALKASDEALRQTAAELLDTDDGATLHDIPYGDRDALDRWWTGLDAQQQRSIISVLITRITIRAGSPGRGFDPSRVRITYAS